MKTIFLSVHILESCMPNLRELIIFPPFLSRLLASRYLRYKKYNANNDNILVNNNYILLTHLHNYTTLSVTTRPLTFQWLLNLLDADWLSRQRLSKGTKGPNSFIHCVHKFTALSINYELI